jgi:serine/threonine-protein kinase
MSLKPGARVGDYRVVKKLGEGGMGEVYLAVHQALGQRVVLKGLHAEFWREPQAAARLEREAAAMARLAHPNIVAIHNFIHVPEGAFIVMEHVEGVSFDDLIRRTGLIPPAQAIELIVPVLRAIEYAHGQGVIHRDLKPANLMLGVEGRVRVLDFGTAKLVDEPGLTRMGTTLGTATYMPPEQLMGQTLTPATDVYAVGVTLYEMCTGRLPYESEDTATLVRQIHSQPPVSPRAYYPPMPAGLEAAILRCLAKRPEDRFRSARDLADALEAVARTLRPAEPAARPLSAPMTAVPAPLPLPAMPRPTAAILASLYVAGAGVIGIVAAFALVLTSFPAIGIVLGAAAVVTWTGATLTLGVLAVAQPTAAGPAPALAPSAPTIEAPVLPPPPAYEPPAAQQVWRHTPLDRAALEAEDGERTVVARREDVAAAIHGHRGGAAPAA